MGVVPTDMVVGGAYPDDRTFARVGRDFRMASTLPPPADGRERQARVRRNVK